MEKQEKSMRPIPKNVRQIGERDDEIKLYIEDYVNTFIRKCARSGKTVVGALIGDYFLNEGKEYLFVEGAVLAEGIQEESGKLIMNDEAWSGLYGKISEFFGERTICGWFICSSEPESDKVNQLRGFMYDNLGVQKRVLILHDWSAEEECFSIYDHNVIREQQGYYLFYERNEPMQAYMVTTMFAARTDPVAVDAVTGHVRTRMVEKKEIPVQKSGGIFMSAAALVLGVVALASGIVMMNHYEQLRDMEAMLTGLVGSGLETQKSTDEDSTEETEPKFGGIIIEDVSGNVRPSQGGDPTEGADISSEVPGESEGTDEPVNGTLADDPTTGTDGQSESAGDDQIAESTAAGNPDAAGEVSNAPEQNLSQTEGTAGKDEPTPQYRTYLVEKGDTLVTICWQIYGYRDDKLIDQICEINHLEDKNRIYAGQELLIP